MKLGKLPPKVDSRTLRLAAYLIPAELPPIPAAWHWSGAVKAWPMMRNDEVGCCTVASAGHMIQNWSANIGKPRVPSDKQILKAYTALSGYNPKTGENDNGAYALDVLNYWRKTGISGRKIRAFVGLDERNHLHIRAAVYLFGGAYIGLNLPLSAQGQKVWQVPSGGPVGAGAPGSWGGHAVNVVDYVPDGWVCVTWGGLKLMTRAFWDAYCDESYAVFSNDFFRGGRTPVGFDEKGLLQDLRKITEPGD